MGYNSGYDSHWRTLMSLAVKSKQPPIKRKLLSRHEAAALLGEVHIRTIDRLLKQRRAAKACVSGVAVW